MPYVGSAGARLETPAAAQPKTAVGREPSAYRMRSRISLRGYAVPPELVFRSLYGKELEVDEPTGIAKSALPAART